MAKRIDIMGQRFGRLVAVQEYPRKGKERRWLCKCDCGNEKIIMMMNLRSGATQSCGCLHGKDITVSVIAGMLKKWPTIIYGAEELNLVAA